MKVKLNVEDEKQVQFLVSNLRSFYTKPILNWQYLRSDCNSSLYLLKVENEYVASQGMIPIYLIQGDTILFSAKSETSYLLPDFRGKGMFEDLYNYTIEKSEDDGCQLIWGFTALSKVWRKKLKFEVHDGLICETALQLNTTVAIRSALRKKQSLLNKFKQSAKAILDSIKNKRVPDVSKEYETRKLEFNTTSMSEVIELFNTWRSVNNEYICINIDLEYLNWRIVNNPQAKYELLGVYKGDEQVGYGIFNHVTNYLVDFIVPKEDDQQDCLYSLIGFLKKRKANSHIIYWASSENAYNSSVSSILLKFGARQYVNNTMNFVRKRTKHTEIDTEQIGNFYINGLWTEGFNI